MKAIKCTVVGDPGIGKSALLKTFMTGEFPQNCEPIIFETFITSPSVDGKDYQLALWYTNGMEEFNRFRPLSYPGSNIVLICFSIEFRTSFDNVMDKWAPEIREYCPETPILLVGLKQDLRYSFTHNRETIKTNSQTDLKDIMESKKEELIGTEEGNQMAGKIGAVEYLEVSSLTQFQLSTLFDEAIRNSAVTPKSVDSEDGGKGMHSCKGCSIV